MASVFSGKAGHISSLLPGSLQSTSAATPGSALGKILRLDCLPCLLAWAFSPCHSPFSFCFRWWFSFLPPRPTTTHARSRTRTRTRPLRQAPGRKALLMGCQEILGCRACGWTITIPTEPGATSLTQPDRWQRAGTWDNWKEPWVARWGVGFISTLSCPPGELKKSERAYKGQVF